MGGDNQKIYIADHRLSKPQELIQVDSINKIKNIKCFSENSLGVIDNESLYFFDPRKGNLVSMLVHNIGKVNNY